jgi:hypothetical protein
MISAPANGLRLPCLCQAAEFDGSTPEPGTNQVKSLAGGSEQPILPHRAAKPCSVANDRFDEAIRKDNSHALNIVTIRNLTL